MPLLETKGAASAQGFGLTIGAAGVANYIEDVFSTWLYTGNQTARSITNGIDLSTKGGLVWIKDRTQAYSNGLFDTARGVQKRISSNSTSATQTTTDELSAFNVDGFSIGNNADQTNATGDNYVSWTFRKQPKFFDVVTYTGTGANRTVAHNLDSVPGCIVVKRTDTTADWQVYHRSLANTQYMVLNTTAAVATGATRWNSTTPTSTVFSLGTDATVNASGGTYVAYLFAHNAGGFGLNGTDNVISCGSFTTDGNGTIPETALGYEPQYVMFKASSTTGAWTINDTMRGQPTPTTANASAPDATLRANNANAESQADNLFPTSTGFRGVFAAVVPSTTYIYIAIRRGPMKVSTTGTSVFAPATRTGTGTTATVTSSISPIDMLFSTNTDRVASTVNSFWDRLRGGGVYLNSNSTNAEASSTSVSGFDVQNGVTMQGALITNGNSYPYVNYNFRRAPGFFDEVCYTGTGSAMTVAHNLAAVPELMIVKSRSTSDAWPVYSAATGNSQNLFLNQTDAAASRIYWNNTTPTTSVFSLGNSSVVSNSGTTYVAYLFASCPGVSKVGSYTGTGSTQTINCGFTGGARFVLIKATSTTGNWLVWDSARGIVSGNDPYLALDSTAAEVTNTDWVDTAATGFELSNAGGNLANSSGVSYVFLAIS